ncbi:glycosyltransferase family A protein [Pedobacter glucosidilyticus]|uniref:glycosyltransferase family A protein n=1 Tax=Pedobacter glucosidilyticus TaxID=1122941 RepID=UPI0026EAD732|nr:glycosyltransferase family A protein [Pedobacter glucosidilyticus]
MKKISFCITCKNRFHQISQTLTKNLSDNRHNKDIVEFVLINFNSNDGLHEWIVQNFKDELKSGYLKYLLSKTLIEWHASTAKNIAHYYATGEILVNLDCDNFTGVDGASFVIKLFENNSKIILHQASNNPLDGSFGRISILKKYFIGIGGYNENFNPMAYQDTDLILRAVEFGLLYTLKNDAKYNEAIPNSKKEGLKYTNSKKSYLTMLSENKLISHINIFKGDILVNIDSLGSIS